MADPIRPVLHRPVEGHTTSAARRSPSAGSFREVMAEVSPEASVETRSPILSAVADAAESIGRGHRFIDRAIRAARRGRELSPEQLIATQAGVYRYTQELELASKIVDKSTQAIKQVLQSQQ